MIWPAKMKPTRSRMKKKKKKSNSLSVEGIQVDIQGAEAELKS